MCHRFQYIDILVIDLHSIQPPKMDCCLLLFISSLSILPTYANLEPSIHFAIPTRQTQTTASSLFTSIFFQKHHQEKFKSVHTQSIQRLIFCLPKGSNTKNFWILLWKTKLFKLSWLKHIVNTC